MMGYAVHKRWGHGVDVDDLPIAGPNPGGAKQSE
jgi:hypothetical protein